MKRKNEKDHQAKKSPGSVEVFGKRRKELNAARPKQRWVGGESVKEGGFWTREEPGTLWQSPNITVADCERS